MMRRRKLSPGGRAALAKPPVLLVVGSVNYDLILTHDRLPRRGETVVGAELVESCGGKGANQAIAAARCLRILGGSGRVVFAGAIGDDVFGERQLAQLRGDGIDASHVRVCAGTSTGIATIWVDGSGDNRILNAPGANLCLTADAVEEVPVEEAALLLLQNEIPAATLRRLAERAAASGVPVVWDPAPFDEGGSLPVPPRACNFITPNETEASGLLGRALRLQAAEEEAVALRELGFPAVLLTLGAGGVAVADAEGNVWREPAVRVRAVDTTAAGDAFSGAVAASLLVGHDLRQAVRHGVRYAGASVARRGAQTSFPHRLDVEIAGAPESRD